MIGAVLLAQLLVFHGNVAMVEDVYRAALDLPANTRATPANAHAVAARLRRFLNAAGYSLATVEAHVEGEQIVVKLDEGRLDKIIFLGGGAFETLRLRLELHLKDDVFNKPDLERQLKSLADRLGLSQFAYEVAPVPNVNPQQQVQLEDFESLEGLSFGLVRPGRPYELHILIQPGEFHSGLSPELEIDSIEGGGIGAVYQTGRLIVGEDRFDLRGRIAGAVRERLDGHGTSFVFTRALGEATYELPPIGGMVRPTFRGRVDLSDRQRPDLMLESFRFETIEGAAQLRFVPIRELTASAGIGVERRILYSLEPADAAVVLPPAIGDRAQTRPFGEAGLQVTFDPEALRRDRHHRLAFEARVYGSPAPRANGAVHLAAGWQKMFPFGWNELWWEAHGVSRTGYVLFPEEESIGGSEALRGPFGAVYARRLVALDLEFRYSLLRDVFKLGVFNNAVGYGALDEARATETPAFADAFGIGVHALLIDEFQLDAYFGWGYATGRRFDRGASLAIRQAF
jgi:hypothetical protein